MTTCNWLDMQTLGSQPVMPKTFPDHCNEGQGAGRTNSELQRNWLSLRINRLKFKTAGELLIVLEEFIEQASNELKQNQRMSTCNRLDLESLGS